MFKTKKWYKEQTLEWNEMIESGWRFSAPKERFENFISIRMNKDGIEASFSVPKAYGAKATHTALLGFCKAVAYEAREGRDEG